MKRALIIGIAGQDGSFLAELLLARGYEVHGTCRPGLAPGDPRLWRVSDCLESLHLHPVDLEDGRRLRDLVAQVDPQECYHLAGTRKPEATEAEACANLEGALTTTHALLQGLARGSGGRFLFAASSEMYGPEAPPPQDEGTRLDPRTSYAIAKAAGFHLVRQHREQRGLRGCSAILFNHESARRGEGFVTRRIAEAAARIRLGQARELRLGDLSASRDWGHARSFVEGMWRMLQVEAPEDLVLATGTTHTVRDFAEAAFRHVGLDLDRHLVVDPALVRPAGWPLRGDPSRAGQVIDWRDEVPFEALVAEMVDAELERAQAGVGSSGSQWP